MRWCPMNKGVANFYHYHAVARAANERYLNALAVVDVPCATAQQVDRVSKPAKFGPRRRRGLNLLHPDEQRLFRAVLRGDWRLNGFRNRDLVEELFGSGTVSMEERRRRSLRVCRQLQLLRAHGLIAKIPHSNRYQVTVKGEALMCGAIYLRFDAFPKALNAVAWLGSSPSLRLAQKGRGKTLTPSPDTELAFRSLGVLNSASFGSDGQFIENQTKTLAQDVGERWWIDAEHEVFNHRVEWWVVLVSFVSHIPKGQHDETSNLLL